MCMARYCCKATVLCLVNCRLLISVLLKCTETVLSAVPFTLFNSIITLIISGPASTINVSYFWFLLRDAMQARPMSSCGVCQCVCYIREFCQNK